MVFLSWVRPTPREQKVCIDRSRGLNYEAKFRGATAKSLSTLQQDKELSNDGFLLNHARVLVGSGVDTYEKGKRALQDWRHFGLNWAFVDPKTPVQNGVKFCVCVKEFLPWLMMPLQIVYVNENRSRKQSMASFRFGGGTLQGHLLAGEERFSIELDEDNQVCYLVQTNKTTYELVRWRRIPYLRGIPERVYPFSKGACRNLYQFCCVRTDKHRMTPLPTAQELEEKSRPSPFMML